MRAFRRRPCLAPASAARRAVKGSPIKSTEQIKWKVLFHFSPNHSFLTLNQCIVLKLVLSVLRRTNVKFPESDPKYSSVETELIFFTSSLSKSEEWNCSARTMKCSCDIELKVDKSTWGCVKPIII